MAIIESEVRLVGKDAGVSAMFESVAAKIDRLAKSAKVSAPFTNLANGLSKAEAQLKAFDKVASSKTLSEVARQRAAVTRQALEDSKKLVAATEAPTRAMQRDLAAREAAHAKAISMYRREATVALEARKAATGMGLSLTDQAGQQARLRHEIESTTAAMERQVVAERKAATQAAAVHAAAERRSEQRAHFLSHHGVVGTMLGAAAGYATVHGVLGIGEKAWEAGAERQHVLTGMRTAGFSPDELTRAQTLAVDVSRQAPNLSISQILELHKEAAASVQHREEAFTLMPALAQAASVLKGMGVENANVADLVKAGESLGLMNNPERFRTFLSGQVKAQQVFGRTISTEGIYEAAKYSKAAGSTLSDDFLNGVLPSLIQEMHGSSAGDALSSLNKRLRGGLVHQHMAVERLNQMGLLPDQDKIKRSKTGEIIGYSGRIAGEAMLTSDPDKWFNQYFKQGAAKVGATALADVNKLLTETLPGTAANLGRILIQQEETIRQHQENLHNALGTDDAMKQQLEDWKAATESFKASLEDLGAAVTGVNMARAAKGVSWLSDELKALAKVASDHPFVSVPAAAAGGVVAAGGAAYLGWQFMTAGTSLQTAAAMLQEAAIKQGAVPRGVPLGGGAAGVEIGSALGSGAVGLAAGAGTAATIAGLAWLIGASHDAQRAGRGGMWAPATFDTLQSDQEDLADMRERLQAKRDYLAERQSRNKMGSFGFDSFDAEGDAVSKEIAELENQIRLKAASLRLVPQFPIGPAGGSLPTMVGMGLKPDIPTPSIGGNSFLGNGGTVPGPSAGQAIDVTGKVQAETKVDLQANFSFSGLPDGVSLTKTYQGTVSSPSTGPTMAGAGQVRRHFDGIGHA